MAAAGAVNQSPTPPAFLLKLPGKEGTYLRCHSTSKCSTKWKSKAMHTGNRRARWDPEKLALMAAFETKNPKTRNINQRIKVKVLPHRTLEAIKGTHQVAINKACVRQESLQPHIS
ncbi:hypothetical protein E2C01_065038 [Portunus trituberculatus]|uniref:Uncharacterized protein n=1 Tax=Portunus trituberculatus TaxID=210409 RepID=A0A5B7HDF1_PORTR|nr:hypothetical protein [Portunus trituberculatus]